MHQKSQKNNHGSAKLLDHHLVFKNDNNRFKTSNPSTSTQNSSSEEFNSPYKKFLGKIKHINIKNDSDDDFKTPVKSKPNVIKQKQSKKQKSSIKKSKNSTIPNLVLKRTKDNFKNLDVNPEHLQMALALSKSTYAEEYPEEHKDTAEPDLPSFLSPNKIPRVTTFLEKYGFKSSRPKYQTERTRDYFEETRKPKSSKFRFLTPVLYSRSEEERKSLINSKVSLILNQQNTILSPINTSQVHENLNSAVLSRYVHNKRSWKANDLDELNSYVCQSIQISFQKSVVGCLLKNWSDIPGREDSQTHSHNYETREESKDELTETLLSSDNANVLQEQQKSFNNQIKETLEELKDGTDQIENVNRVVDSENEKEHSINKENTASCDEIIEKRIESCASPDLFSEDESDNLPAINRSHKEMTTSTSYNLNEPIGTKSPSIPVENNKNVSICQLSDCDEKCESAFSNTSEHNEKSSQNNSIEYFESFYDDDKNLFQHNTETVDLTCDSDEDIKVPGNHGKTDKSKECTEMDEENLETSPKILFGNKYSSMDSGNASCEYNSTKSLNVTDYVMAFLNSQENADDQGNPEIFSQSQSTCSQESIVVLSDEELNYSNKFSTNYQNNLFDLTNFDNGQDYLGGSDYKKGELDAVHAELTNKYNQKQVDQNETVVNIIKDSTTTTLEECPDVSTPEKIGNDQNIGTASVTTPNDNILIKTDQVTPMADFDNMDTPNIRAELSKFGIKPLKKRRGVQLLKYIYESTHPYVNTGDVGTASSEQEERPIKKRKLSNQFERVDKENIRIVGSALIDCENQENLIFERKFSKKISSCCVPLQIVWYNFMCCNPSLAENIILYEPIQLEVIHSMLKEQTECHFHIQDLITFLDKKCITFRTNQCQGNKRK